MSCESMRPSIMLRVVTQHATSTSRWALASGASRITSTKLLALATLASSWLCPHEAAADCRDRYSTCFVADTQWVDPFPGPGQVVAAPQHAPRANNAGSALPQHWVGIQTSFQDRPLEVVAAAPDPRGTEVRVLDDWWTLQPFVGLRFQRWQVAAVLPLSASSTGLGAAAADSRIGKSRRTGIGDLRAYARLTHDIDHWTLLVTQQLSLPLGDQHSYLSLRSVGYAPKVSLQYRGPGWWWTAELGARLHAPVQFADVRFGSEGYSATAVGVRLGSASQLFAELWTTPALMTQPSLTRIPAEWLLALDQRWQPLSLQVGGGTSLALSRERVGAETRAVSGPPGPTVRAFVQATVEW